MRILLNILGVIFGAVGIVWVLQGLNIVHGSSMSGHRRWIAIGAVLIVAAVAAFAYGYRRKASKPK